MGSSTSIKQVGAILQKYHQQGDPGSSGGLSIERHNQSSAGNWCTLALHGPEDAVS